MRSGGIALVDKMTASLRFRDVCGEDLDYSLSISKRDSSLPNFPISRDVIVFIAGEKLSDHSTPVQGKYPDG